MAENRQELNRNLAQMLKGGVIMDVTTPEQARIAEAAGACAVMALERIPVSENLWLTMVGCKIHQTSPLSVIPLSWYPRMG